MKSVNPARSKHRLSSSTRPFFRDCSLHLDSTTPLGFKIQIAYFKIKIVFGEIILVESHLMIFTNVFLLQVPTIYVSPPLPVSCCLVPLVPRNAFRKDRQRWFYIINHLHGSFLSNKVISNRPRAFGTCRPAQNSNRPKDAAAGGASSFSQTECIDDKLISL